jgi:hypothetical protein
MSRRRGIEGTERYILGLYAVMKGPKAITATMATVNSNAVRKRGLFMRSRRAS